MGSGSWCIFHSCMCIILSVARSTSCLYDISISVGSILTHDSFLDFSFRFMIRNSQIAWITVQKPKAIPNQNFWLLTEHWIPQLPKNTIVDLCASVLVCWCVGMCVCALVSRYTTFGVANFVCSFTKNRRKVQIGKSLNLLALVFGFVLCTFLFASVRHWRAYNLQIPINNFTKLRARPSEALQR